MATNIQRVQAIADALLNKPASAAQLARIGESLASSGGRGAEYASLSNNDKAGFVIARVRGFVMSVIKANDAELAGTAALTNSNALVDTEFSEAP